MSDTCKECGNPMEVTDGEYKETGIYGEEPEVITLWEERTCTVCGHFESTEPEYNGKL